LAQGFLQRLRGSSRRFGRNGGVGGCPLHGSTRESRAGALGRLVPLLGSDCSLPLGFEGASQGSVARGLAVAFAFQALGGGGGVGRLLLDDLVGEGGVFGAFGGGRRGSHGGARMRACARGAARRGVARGGEGRSTARADAQEEKGGTAGSRRTQGRCSGNGRLNLS